MLQRIISIKNIGHFVDFKLKGSKDWNGSLSKVNIIYAPNGSGKTTLSTILKSLKLNKPELVDLKKTFGSTDSSSVEIKESGKSDLIEFNGISWNRSISNMEVFDINYIEDYLFSGSYSKRQNKVNLFKLLLGEKGIELKNKCKPLIHAKERAEKALFNGNELEPKLRETLLSNHILAVTNLSNALMEYEAYSKSIFENHIEVVNKYLEKFTTYIKLADISFQKDQSEFETFRILMTFNVYGEKVQFLAPDLQRRVGNARYALSEGDKSTIALCFFLARLDIEGTNNKIIVFDDPLSSFDYSRKNSTIFQLVKVANSAEQLILLTHDLNFANDFTDKSIFLDPINLKIDNDGESSFLCFHDIKSEYLTSTQKDINTIKTFLKDGYNSESDRREIIRCIRPVLEGVIKTKYFDLFEENMWLGDLISEIRTSQNTRLGKLKKVNENIMELNDFTKQYHHSSGNFKNDQINPTELRRYIQLLMIVIDQI